MRRVENLLKSKDVAHLCDCSPDDVIMACRQRLVSAVKHGRFWRMTRTEAMKLQRIFEARRAAK